MIRIADAAGNQLASKALRFTVFVQAFMERSLEEALTGVDQMQTRLMLQLSTKSKQPVAPATTMTIAIPAAIEGAFSYIVGAQENPDRCNTGSGTAAVIGFFRRLALPGNFRSAAAYSDEEIKAILDEALPSRQSQFAGQSSKCSKIREPSHVQWSSRWYSRPNVATLTEPKGLESSDDYVKITLR